MAEHYEHVVVTSRTGYAIVTLNRPEVLNALSTPLMHDLAAALEALDADPSCRCAIITGNERAFAAGADIAEMAGQTVISMLLRDQFAVWERLRAVRIPLIAAVSGYALGGGCELAMLCDMIVASETAQFGQPEINIGVMPGAGGTQRLTRAVGKARAMEMILTGTPINAREALAAGLVNRVVPVELYLREAEALAARIAAQAPLAVRVAKESILKAFDGPLDLGLDFERRSFYLLFASEDQKEGMRAFLDKRRPSFEGR
ncbi:MAG TPA: enoyl-CoA hydratase-related protein [Chloroflexota bacterium]|nr:enoyl-CoA hydratase-related protein [Chloroflexota bacterium]